MAKNSSLFCSAAWEFCNLNHNLEDAFLAFSGAYIAGESCCNGFCRWFDSSAPVNISSTDGKLWFVTHFPEQLLSFQLGGVFFVWSVLYHCYSNWSRTTPCSSFAFEIQFHNNYKPRQTCHSRYLVLGWTLLLTLVA